MIVVVVGISLIGLCYDLCEILWMCCEGLIVLFEDFGICCIDVLCELLVVKSIVELVEWFGGLY